MAVYLALGLIGLPVFTEGRLSVRLALHLRLSARAAARRAYRRADAAQGRRGQEQLFCAAMPVLRVWDDRPCVRFAVLRLRIGRLKQQQRVRGI